MSVEYFDQLLGAARQVPVVYLAQLLGAVLLIPIYLITILMPLKKYFRIIFEVHAPIFVNGSSEQPQNDHACRPFLFK